LLKRGWQNRLAACEGTATSLRAETLRKLKREHETVQVCTENFIYRL
jgi:hypothetical protein